MTTTPPRTVLRIREYNGYLWCTCGGFTGGRQGDICGHIRALQDTGTENGKPRCDAPRNNATDDCSDARLQNAREST